MESGQCPSTKAGKNRAIIGTTAARERRHDRAACQSVFDRTPTAADRSGAGWIASRGGKIGRRAATGDPEEKGGEASRDPSGKLADARSLRGSRKASCFG
ncbi:hypothetical protein D3H35_27570 [Cohnella faecalis]|uniref:Uncharacterized protein n=1 Tax=Cohnella faecalis TaxID=2315694 RepID=A0A398CCS7_9BACL|nr:hypothetical protein D3H35_27570 [Cohnella faecalis]